MQRRRNFVWVVWGERERCSPKGTAGFTLLPRPGCTETIRKASNPTPGQTCLWGQSGSSSQRRLSVCILLDVNVFDHGKSGIFESRYPIAGWNHKMGTIPPEAGYFKHINISCTDFFLHGTQLSEYNSLSGRKRNDTQAGKLLAACCNQYISSRKKQ